jgi:archaellum component FlaC
MANAYKDLKKKERMSDEETDELTAMARGASGKADSTWSNIMNLRKDIGDSIDRIKKGESDFPKKK